MNPQQCMLITADRFAQWGRLLALKNATPAVAIGIGHGPHSGEVHMVMPENMTSSEVLSLLTGVCAELIRKGARL